ncbi:MAG: hypothetical protein ACUZ8A_03050 [Candidatus Bathyanammoxibius sp.]
MLVGSKGLTIISVFMGLVAIFSVAFAVTATSKYCTQRHRVIELEEKILLSKEQMLRIPQTQLKAQEEATARQEVEGELAEAMEQIDSINEEFAEYRHSAELVAVAKVVVGTLLAEATKELHTAKEARATAEETAAALEEENERLEKEVAALDLDVRVAETKIRNLTKELGGETSSLYHSGCEAGQVTQASGSEGSKVSHLGFGLAVTGHEVVPGSCEELQALRGQVSDLTNELVSLTKARISAEKALSELQMQVASR